MIVNYKTPWPEEPKIKSICEDLDIIHCELKQYYKSLMNQSHTLVLTSSEEYTYYVDSLDHPFYKDRTIPAILKFNGNEYYLSTDSELLRCYDDLQLAIHNDNVERTLSTV